MRIRIADTTLRDGSHSVRHQFELDEIRRIAGALDAAGIDLIEVGHGDGLTGSTCNYGFSKHEDFEIIAAAAEVVKQARLAVLLLPGIGTIPDLHRAWDAGARAVRVATHVTEADIAEQHIRAAKKMGYFTVGFLMMAHRSSVERIVEEALKMESYGADVVYATDSAGAMLPNEVRAKFTALRRSLEVPLGFHSHNNLGLAIGNTVAALENGATWVDGSLAGLGAGAGNTTTELLVAVLNRLGYPHGADLYRTMDAAAVDFAAVAEAHGLTVTANQDAMMLGYAGVYSSFMLHTKRAAKRFGVDYRDIILELGRREAVGGQEDWIQEIAAAMAAERAGQTR
ncbi:MAG: 4-hydroxy-2-oxovalerate aldolase [Bacillota bacterium]|nr:4-hydroxy-2-oxovalerate aldolase [Bacillota bacterium]